MRKRRELSHWMELLLLVLWWNIDESEDTVIMEGLNQVIYRMNVDANGRFSYTLGNLKLGDRVAPNIALLCLL